MRDEWISGTREFRPPREVLRDPACGTLELGLPSGTPSSSIALSVGELSSRSSSELPTLCSDISSSKSPHESVSCGRGVLIVRGMLRWFIGIFVSSARVTSGKTTQDCSPSLSSGLWNPWAKCDVNMLVLYAMLVFYVMSCSEEYRPIVAPCIIPAEWQSSSKKDCKSASIRGQQGNEDIEVEFRESRGRLVYRVLYTCHNIDVRLNDLPRAWRREITGFPRLVLKHRVRSASLNAFIAEAASPSIVHCSP